MSAARRRIQRFALQKRQLMDVITRARIDCATCKGEATVLQIDCYPEPIPPSWKSHDSPGDEKPSAVSFADLHESADKAEAIIVSKGWFWHFECSRCGNQDPAYYVYLNNMENERQALSWYMHLAEKDWFVHSLDSWNAALSELFPGAEQAA